MVVPLKFNFTPNGDNWKFLENLPDFLIFFLPNRSLLYGNEKMGTNSSIKMDKYPVFLLTFGGCNIVKDVKNIFRIDGEALSFNEFCIM